MDQMSRKPQKWAIDYIVRSGDQVKQKYAYVRAVDICDALDTAIHKIEFDKITASRVSPETPSFEDYEITSIGIAG